MKRFLLPTTVLKFGKPCRYEDQYSNYISSNSFLLKRQRSDFKTSKHWYSHVIFGRCFTAVIKLLTVKLASFNENSPSRLFFPSGLGLVWQVKAILAINDVDFWKKVMCICRAAGLLQWRVIERVPHGINWYHAEITRIMHKITSTRAVPTSQVLGCAPCFQKADCRRLIYAITHLEDSVKALAKTNLRFSCFFCALSISLFCSDLSKWIKSHKFVVSMLTYLLPYVDKNSAQNEAFNLQPSRVCSKISCLAPTVKDNKTGQPTTTASETSLAT